MMRTAVAAQFFLYAHALSFGALPNGAIDSGRSPATTLARRVAGQRLQRSSGAGQCGALSLVVPSRMQSDYEVPGEMVPDSELGGVTGRSSGNAGVEICRSSGDRSSPVVRVWMFHGPDAVTECEGQTVNVRVLQFNPPPPGEAPLDAQTEVRCLGPPAPSCFEGGCGECPCVRDSRELLAPSMGLVFTRLEPLLCQANGQRRLLLLGLGGGELAQHVLTHCPNVAMDAVELHGQVLVMGKRYLGLQPGERLVLKQDSALNATQSLARSGQKYDAVVVDCFGDGGRVPIDCRSRQFLAAVYETLKPGGTVLQGIWHYSPDDGEVEREFFATKEAYKQEFGEAPSSLPVDLPLNIHWADVLVARRTEPFSMGRARPFGARNASSAMLPPNPLRR